jgi:hypothetical protein
MNESKWGGMARASREAREREPAQLLLGSLRRHPTGRLGPVPEAGGARFRYIKHSRIVSSVAAATFSQASVDRSMGWRTPKV